MRDSIQTSALSRAEAAAIRKLHKRRERKVAQRFLVEGVRAVGEAVRARLGMHRAIISPRLDLVEGGTYLREELHRRSVPVAEVSDRTLRTLSDTDHPQGVLVVAVEPEVPLQTLDGDRGVLVLDRVQDPGNVGTLVRSAHAFGCGGVVALEGTADPWGAKAVRASAGSLFHLPVARASTAELLEWKDSTAPPVRLMVAAAGGVRATPAHGAWALVVGSEGHGVSEGLMEASDAVVSIMMPGGAESLNAAVAGSLLLHQLTVSDLGDSPENQPVESQSE